jgi:hypothetical protein
VLLVLNPVLDTLSTVTTHPLPFLVFTLVLVEDAVPLALVVALVEYGKPEALYATSEFHLRLTAAEDTVLVRPSASTLVTRNLAVHFQPLPPPPPLLKLVIVIERPGAAGRGEGLQEGQDMRVTVDYLRQLIT